MITSVRGSGHEKTGVVCQDSSRALLVADDFLIAAIADGAGSAEKSEVGSLIAVETAIQCLQEITANWNLPEEDEDWKLLILKVFKSAREAVEAEALRLDAPSRELASTLIVLLATQDFAVVGQIGDGAVVLSGSEGSIIALTVPQSGEFINETIFLTASDALEQIQTITYHGEISNLAAFSDGLQMLALKMSDGTPHQPFFAPLFKFVSSIEDRETAANELKSFLQSPRISERTDDDLSLFLAHRAPQNSFTNL